MSELSPQFPLYIPTKSRFDYMITSRVLSELKIKHYLVVEPQEIDKYQNSIRDNNILAEVLPLDISYKEKYELCDDLGLSKSTGPGPARNFAWDHSITNGYKWHWVMDDNITSFRRLNNNEKVKVRSGSIFRAMEDFCLRYQNVVMAGPNYFMFASARNNKPPFVINTRIYSCNLIKNDTPFRWRGRYNEDTILSLDILKANLCTIQFNAFLQEKMRTQTIGGGNTKEFYAAEGTLPKSAMLYKVHPDVTEVVFKYKRWHHYVDYSRFKRVLPLRAYPDDSFEQVDNYGMGLSIKK